METKLLISEVAKVEIYGDQDERVFVEYSNARLSELGVSPMQLKDLLGRLTRNRILGALTGAFVTAILDSSSVTTVLVVGFVSAGIMTLGQSVGVIMGANVGTTVTALLAALAATDQNAALGLTVALVHLLFNIGGICIIFPIRAIRRIPIRLAEKLAEFSLRSRLVPLLYLVFLFFLLPGLIILGQRILSGS